MNTVEASAPTNRVTGVPESKLRLWIVAFGFLAFFVAYMDRVNVSVLIADPAFTKALGITAAKATQGLLMSVFLLGYGVSCFLVGPIVQHFGPKKSLVVGLLSWALLTCLMGAVSSIGVMLLLRALLGLGEGVLAPGVSKLIQTWFPVHERSRANGGWYIGLQMGYIIATPLVAWWVAALGWRMSFYILALIGVVPLLSCLHSVYDRPSEHPHIAKSEVDYIATSDASQGSVAAALTTDLKFLRNSSFWYLTIIFSLANAEIWGFVTWIPSYLKSTLGFSWAAMGSLAMLPYICGAIGVILFMPLMDRYNRRALFIFVGNVILTILLGIAMSVSGPLAAIIVLSLAHAAGGPRTPAVHTMVQNVTGKEQVASAAGVFTGIGYMFASVTPYTIGVLYKLTGSLKAGFWFLAFLSVLAFLFCIPLVRRRL